LGSNGQPLPDLSQPLSGIGLHTGAVREKML
jgi:hypothetical protein